MLARFLTTVAALIPKMIGSRKRLHDPPKLQAIDPDFGEEYDEAKHGDTLDLN